MRKHFLFQLIVAALVFCNAKVWADNAVPFVIDSQDKWTTFYTGTSSNATMSWSDTFVKMARLSGSWDKDRYFDLAFTGEPSKISFSYKNDEGSTYGKNIKMKIQESTNGTGWTTVVENVKPSNLSSFKAFGPYNLKNTTRQIRIVMNGVDAEHDFQNITVTAYDPVPAFTIASSEDWGNVSVGKSVAKAITATDLNDAAKDGTWTASISGDDASMFVLSSATPALGACNVTYTPSAAGSHSAVLTLRATNKTDATKYVEKTVDLSGVGDATAVIELTKQGESSPTTSHNFGSVIGTNAATPLVLNVFSSSLAEGPVVEWKTANDAFQFTKSGNAITINAQPAAAVASQDVKNAVLTVKGKSAGSSIYNVVEEFSVSLTANPLIVPTKQWNIGSQLFERNEYSNFFTTNSDGALSVTFSQDNQYLSFANGKLVTAAIPTSPQAVGSITVHYPATATYAAIEETLNNITLVTNPAYLPVTINSEAIYNLLYAGQSNADNKNKANAQWSSSESAVQLIDVGTNTKRYVDFAIKGTPYQLTFQYKNDEGTSSSYKGNIVIKIYEDKGTGNPNSEVLNTKPSSVPDYISYGPYELNSETRKIRIEQSGIYANAWFKDFTIISSNPTLNVTESSVELKANNTQVYDNSIHFSVLKYPTIKVKIEGADFGLVKGSDTANVITFTSADGLNDATFTNCEFKVRYVGAVDGAKEKTASVKFFDGEDHQLGSAVAVSIVAVPVLTFEKPTNGSYTYKYGSEAAVTVNTADKTRDLAQEPYEVTLTATPASGYKFFAWYEKNGDNKTYLSYEATYTPTITTTKTIGAEFISATTPVFIIKGQAPRYVDLNAAITAANGSGTIVLVSNGTLPAGNYTIPNGVTLLIPFDDAYTCYTTSPMILHGWRKEDDSGKKDAVTDPSADGSVVYKMLTLASGAHLYIKGTLSLSAKRWVVIDTGSQGTNQPNISGSGRIKDNYGCITMNEGSTIQVGDGTQAGKLYCWGRIRGEGTISVESGSEAREMFVYADWRDNGKLGNYASSTHCFPLNQFYVQDIQVPITFQAGAKEVLRVGFFNSSGSATVATDIPFIGPNNGDYLMRLASGSITKKYDIPTDRLIFDFDGDITFYKATMSFNYQSASTDSHIFPITNNWTININSGMTSTTYDLNLNAGAIININENATLKLKSGSSLYVYDADDWVWEGSQKYGIGYCSGRRIIPLRLPSYEIAAGTYRDANNQPRYIKSTKYSGTGTAYDAIRLEADLTDAEIRVDGTIIVEGGNNCNWTNKISGLYTTNGSKYGSNNIMSAARDNDGAKIYSAGSGKIVYNQTPGTQTTVDQLNKGTGTGDKAIVTIRPAMLKNDDGSYFSTAGYSAATTFKYVASTGKWGKVSTVTFKNGETVVKAESLAEGEAIVPPAENPTKPGYVFGGWDQPATMGTSDIVCQAIWAAQIIDVKPETTEITADSKKTTQDNTNSTFTVSEPIDATEVTVAEGATVEVDASLSVTETFVIKASENNSGELLGADKVEIPSSANVYFDYNFDNTPAMRWNAIAFPWQVDANSGVKVGSKTLTLGKDFDIVYYNGETRATQGPVDECWKFVEDDIEAQEIDNPNILVPGRLYMILFAASQSVVRFEKVATAPINNTELNVEQFAGSDGDANWNGIANPTLYHAYLSTGVEDGQVYNNASDSYSPFNFATENLIVGRPVFVQATQAQSVVISSEQSAPAPMRATNATQKTRVEVELIANNVATDKVIIRTDEDAVDKYTIGSDLAKAGVSSKVAQMWIDRYGSKLCKNTVAPVDGVAEYSLTIFAPVSGEYELAISTIDNDMTLYLTQYGEAIAELTGSGYSLFLDKGNNDEYGLRLVGKTIPGVVTSLDEAVAQGKNLNKVIYRGNLYIIRDRKVYTAAGQLIK